MLRQIPIGYRIENGKAVIDENEAELIRSVFRYYLEGMSLNGISEKTGIGNSHGGISAILTCRNLQQSHRGKGAQGEKTQPLKSV